MPRYTLHYNPGCQECVRLARWNARLDWLRRFARIAGPSPNGMPEPGDIHVVDNRTSVIYSGAYAARVVCLNIPLYWPVAALRCIPFVFQTIARRKPGCNGNQCSV